MEIAILLIEAVVAYGLVLGSHALRHKVRLTYFYAIIGSITAIMSWVTDAGIKVEVGDVTFLVGSTVFYTSLLLGVFVVYVFDGVRATRVAIYTIVGISILVPLIALVLNIQMKLVNQSPLGYIPTPSLRINAASVFATMMDLIFLAVAWEYLNRHLKRLHYWIRSFITLLGVMWLDVILFNTGAFAGNPGFWSIIQGTLYSRFIITLFAAPILLAYLSWETRRNDLPREQRPILAILKQLSEVELELSVARKEIERRKRAEAALKENQLRLRQLATTDDLTGLFNRRHFRDSSKHQISGSRRHKRPLTLLLIDVDRFKSVNDNYGHDIGDLLLVKLADAIREATREIDILGRIGGEEFTILLPDTDLGGGKILAERLQFGVRKMAITTDAGPLSIRISIGVASLNGTDDVDGLFKKADTALYRAKNLGRDRVELFSDQKPKTLHAQA